MEHGVAKVLRGPDVFAGILQQLGLPLPQVAAWLTISTEILGGLAVLLGALVSWASIPLAAVKLLSISASGANFGPVGYEVDVVYLTALVMLILQGPGPLAIDNLRKGKAGEWEQHMDEILRAMAITIRPAGSEDADGIARTFLQSAEYHASLDPERYAVPTLETISARYRERLQHSPAKVVKGINLVAEISGEIVGFIDIRLERSPDPMHQK